MKNKKEFKKKENIQLKESKKKKKPMINLIREKQERKNAQLEKYQSMLMKTKNKTP